MLGDFCWCQFTAVFPVRLVPQRPNCSSASCSGAQNQGRRSCFLCNFQMDSLCSPGSWALTSSPPVLCSTLAHRAQAPCAGPGISQTADSLPTLAGAVSPLSPQVLLLSGSQSRSANISSHVPSSLVGEVDHLWASFFFPPGSFSPSGSQLDSEWIPSAWWDSDQPCPSRSSGCCGGRQH